MIDYNIYDLGFNRFLNRELTPLILQTTNNLNSPTILGSGMGGLSEISPSEIASGELDGNITMVLGKLQSANFVSGSTGWIINYDGTVEFNSGVFRGSLTAASIDIPLLGGLSI
jgi:hypothetical protein